MSIKVAVLVLTFGVGIAAMALPEADLLPNEWWPYLFYGGMAIALVPAIWLLLIGLFKIGLSGNHHWRWMWRLRFERGDTWPFCVLTPLQEAARLTYEETRATIVVSLMERLEKTPEAMIGTLAEMLVQDKNIAIFGVYPPSQKLEQIPDDDAHTFGFTDDATEMFDRFNKKRRYRDLYIKRKDFKRRLSEIKTKNEA